MIIDIHLNDNREIKCSNTIIGKTFENEATALRFHLTEEMADKDFYLEFEKADGNKSISSKIKKIEDENGTFVIYFIPNSLLDIKGNLKCEVVLRKDEEVWKSYTLNFNVLNSINASEEIGEKYPDFVSEAQKVIDLIEIDGSGTKYLSDDGTYKEVQGGGSTETTNYENLDNKPSINDVELTGNKTLEELGIQPKGNYLTEIPSEYITEEELNNKGYLTKESDPTVPQYVKDITEEDIDNWNNKSEFSGDYNDLDNKPTIPDKTSDLTNDSGFITKEDIPSVDLSNYYNKDEIDDMIGDIGTVLDTLVTVEEVE